MVKRKVETKVQREEEDDSLADLFEAVSDMFDAFGKASKSVGKTVKAFEKLCPDVKEEEKAGAKQ